MFRNFTEIENFLLANGVCKRIALAGAHDADALEAVIQARRKGVAEAALIGRADEIRGLLKAAGERESDYTIIGVEGDGEIARTACRMTAQGDADIPMKGLLHTASFMRAVLDKEMGFVPENGLLSQATIFEFPQQQRLVIATDCAVNIAPAYEEKLQLIANAVRLAHQMGNICPKVAILAPVEVVNPKIPATIEAALLAKASDRGQIKRCVVDGPLALDNAISEEAARHKRIAGPVAGRADVLVMPDLDAGNIFTKSLTFFAELRSAGTVMGTVSPVVMTSRTDTPENKYASILMAILQALDINYVNEKFPN